MKKTLLELLKAELVGELPPEGWYTITQLMSMLDVKRGMAESLVARKKWECKKYRSQTKDGKTSLCNHYRSGKL